MISKEDAYIKIAELVERFSEQIDSYKKVSYNETQTRRDFIYNTPQKSDSELR